MTQFTCKGVKQINNWISLNMTFTFTIRISRRFSSAREFQMGNFLKYWSQNVGQDFIVLFFFTGGRFWKLTGGTLKIGSKMLPPQSLAFNIYYYYSGGCDRMVVEFTTIYAIGANHHWCCEFESRSGQGVQHYAYMWTFRREHFQFSTIQGRQFNQFNKCLSNKIYQS
jgi:hypothetical protein